MKKFLPGIAIVLACSGTAQAVELINQNFDITGTFFPGVTGNVGYASGDFGRWGPFDGFGFTDITNSVSNSPGQSLVVTRGGDVIGRVDATVSTPDFEIAYSLYRVSADSSLIVQVSNNVTVRQDLELATYIKANGALSYYDVDAWVETTAIIPVGEWTDIRLAVDATAMDYDLFVTPDGGTETFVQTIDLAALPAAINAFRFNPQGLAGSVSYIDDVLLADSVSDVIEGDLDGDGFVGISDLNLVLGSWNLNVPPADPLADPTGDNFVGIADLNTVLGNWNAGAAPSTGSAVPEPAALVLVGAGAMGLVNRRRNI